MEKSQDTRLENAEVQFNGFKDTEKDLDLLRECVKTILDEQRRGRKKTKTAEQ